jgi:hypothetical protein
MAIVVSFSLLSGEKIALQYFNYARLNQMPAWRLQSNVLRLMGQARRWCRTALSSPTPLGAHRLVISPARRVHSSSMA